MAIRSALIGGKPLQAGLAGFFKAEVTIMRASGEPDDYGEVVNTWAPLLDHVNLSAMVVGGDVSIRMKKQEFTTSKLSLEALYRRVLLNGSYPEIDHSDRVRLTSDDLEWAIISIVNDPSSTFTELLIESIEPGNI